MVTDTLIAVVIAVVVVEWLVARYKRTTICSKGFSADKTESRYLLVLPTSESVLQARDRLIKLSKITHKLQLQQTSFDFVFKTEYSRQVPYSLSVQ